MITSDTQHMITDITVSGQSVFASDQGCPVSAFDPAGWLGATGHRSLGIPLAARQQVVVSGDPASVFGPAAASNVGMAIGTAPIEPQQVIPVNQLGGEALSYVCGLGEIPIAAAAAATLTCTIRRPVMLGALTLDFDAGVVDDYVVRSVTINNVQMLSGENGVLGEIPLSVFLNNSSDIDGKIIGYPAPLNGQFSVEIFNYGAVAANIAGACFTVPGMQTFGG